MRQTRKGNQWYFGMKAHIGVDRRGRMIHSVVATAANVHDSQVLEDLLHGEETRVWGDSAYAGKKQVLRENAPDTKDFTQPKGSRHLALSDEERLCNRSKTRVCSKVEHVFHVMKRQFGFTRVRYRGLDKKAHFLFVNCALINLVMAKGRLSELSQGMCAWKKHQNGLIRVILKKQCPETWRSRKIILLKYMPQLRRRIVFIN